VPADDLLQDHCATVIDAVREQRVVFLLGAGVNLCGRPEGLEWEPDGCYLPTGQELADYLAARYRLPSGESHDLPRVAQYIAAKLGEGPLSMTLHELFDVECAPTKIHTLLARLPGRLRDEGSESPHQFIVTTNYDDVLERAFEKEGAEFDLFVYSAHGENRGRVLHRAAGGESRVVHEPNKMVDLLTERSAILKIHGAIDRLDAERDSWVITEEHYVEYLTHPEIGKWLPVALCDRLKTSHLECLGYSLRDWNLRAILRRLRQDRDLRWNWWAVQLESGKIDRYVWMKQDLEILDARLEDYADALAAALPGAVAAGPGP
jgi:hypothetical protein